MVISFGTLGNPFWAREVQTLEKLHQQYSKDGLVVVAVALDQDKEAVKAFAEKQNLSFVVAVDQKSLKGAELYRLSALPTTYFLDRAHKVNGVQIGFSKVHEPVFAKEAEKLMVKS